MSTKTLENQTFLSGWLDEGAPGRSLATFRSCIAPSGGDGVYTGCDWAAKMGIPAIYSGRISCGAKDPSRDLVRIPRVIEGYLGGAPQLSDKILARIQRKCI